MDINPKVLAIWSAVMIKLEHRPYIETTRGTPISPSYVRLYVFIVSNLDKKTPGYNGFTIYILIRYNLLFGAAAFGHGLQHSALYMIQQ